MTRLLMIDDDEKLVTLMDEYLRPQGFELLSAFDGHAGLAVAQSTAPALVILDLMLPGIDGLEVCRRLRQFSAVPVLMLTARGDETDRIVGLEMGADDYLPKPFNPRELLARVRAILRRAEVPGEALPESALNVGALVMDPGARRVTVGSREVELTTAEFDILLVLARSAGRVLSRDTLLRQVHGDGWAAYDRTIDVHISRLRQKIEDDPRRPHHPEDRARCRIHGLEAESLMRSLFLAAKLTLILGLVLGSVHLGIFFLFVHVAGHELGEVLSRVHAYDGVSTARRVEALLAEGHALSSDAVSDRLAADERRLDLWFTLFTEAEAPREEQRFRRHRARSDRTLDIGGRTVRVLGMPWFEVWVPILHDGETLAALKVRGSGHASSAHKAFHRGLLQIALVAMLGVIVLTIFLTRPLRRMRRSMDRIAEGDLDHRVKVRGADEVAAMGKSFNAMADRIGTMIQGQKELMAGVSHELRSPLARMKVALALLHDQAPALRVEDLESEIDALDGLVGELLAASRFDLGAASLSPRPLDVVTVVEAAWAATAERAETVSVDLDLQLASDAEKIDADRALATRIFRNLFQNALRYAPNTAVTVISRVRSDGRVEITVADGGPGVDAGQRERLFEPFYRVDPARAVGHGAVGLGLMIVRRAVEAHGGTVRAEAATGGGLAVVFDLPAGSNPQGRGVKHRVV